MADSLTLIISQSQLSHSILTSKITNFQQKSTYTAIHHAAIAKLFGLLTFPGQISTEENGILTANEILGLKLNSELVVLSACNTGRGRITGDGVVGLSRAFVAAKVPSVVVSLWSVPDNPTASLMTEFYRHMQYQPDKAIALRQAMLTTMKQYPHPFDWAAFVLIGEP